MKKARAIGSLALLVGAVVSVAGCAAGGSGEHTQTTEPSAGRSTIAAAASASPTSDAGLFPGGQPPRPGAQTSAPASATVPGLTAAVAGAAHPGLQICGADIVSTVIASGDLRGNGTVQQLVLSTCAGATATSPDEVAIYEGDGHSLRRTAVVYEATANRPRLTAEPYLFGAHTVVLTFDEGADYRLVRVLPDRVVPGLVSRFS